LNHETTKVRKDEIGARAQVASEALLASAGAHAQRRSVLFADRIRLNHETTKVRKYEIGARAGSRFDSMQECAWRPRPKGGGLEEEKCWFVILSHFPTFVIS
jgi:hypothetical protein